MSQTLNDELTITQETYVDYYNPQINSTSTTTLGLTKCDYCGIEMTGIVVANIRYHAECFFKIREKVDEVRLMKKVRNPYAT